MIGLIPAELWDYGVGDLAHGFLTAIGPSEGDGTLFVPGLGDCIPTRSARAALVTALQALNMRANARIGVPLYCCAVVFKAITAAGYRPRFIDVNPSTFCMSPADLRTKAADVDAIIAVHMFGNICDVPELRKAAPGKPIIEDCALSLGSKLNGLPTGSFGELAVLSFRSGKYLSVGEGGALFSQSEGLRRRAAELVAALPTPTAKEECVHVAKTFLRSALRSEPLYGVAGYRLWKAYNKRAVFSAKSPVVQTQSFRTDLALTRKRLVQLDAAIEVQRANADYLTTALRFEPDMLCCEKPGTFYNRYQFPVTFSSPDQRGHMASYLHAKGIDTSRPVHDATEVASSYYGYENDCPASERLSQTALVFPAYHTLQKSQLQYIAESLNAGWAIICRQPKAVASAVPDDSRIRIGSDSVYREKLSSAVESSI